MEAPVAKKAKTSTETETLAGVLGVHDLGGVKVEDEKLPATTAEEAFAQWEIEACALAKTLCKSGVTVVDETRRLIESLPAREYARLRYYEKWTCGSAMLALGAGIFTERELEHALGADEAEAEASFVEGQRVRVLSEKAHVRWRKPHVRTPGYVHGKEGVVVRRNGTFEAPETLAFALLRPRAREATLYTVRFRQTDLWHHYPEGADTLDLDVYSHWLEAIEANSTAPTGDVGRGWTTFGTALAKVHAPHAGHHEARDVVETEAVAKELARDSPYARLHAALVDLCVEKGVFQRNQLRQAAEDMDAYAYGGGGEAARLVARAWVDPDFKARLCADANAAIRADFPDVAAAVDDRGGMGSTLVTTDKFQDSSQSHGETKLVVVPSSSSVHNVVVCTLCSCYPRAILGLPPRYYTSRAYRARAVSEPRKVLEDFGCRLPATVKAVRVHDSTADVRFLVLPERPPDTDDLDEDALAKLVTRDCLVGLALPRRGRTVAGT